MTTRQPDSEVRLCGEQELPFERGPFLRRRHWFCALCATGFVITCIGVVVCTFIHGRREADVAVYFLNLVPPFLWISCFSVAIVLTGALGVRLRWLFVGSGVCVICLVSAEDFLQWVSMNSTGRRERFESLREEFLAADADRAENLRGIPLRVVTWNVRSGRMGAREAMDQLAALDPDVVLMQEFAWGGLSKAVDLSEELRSFSFERRHGRAILSRFPVQARTDAPLLVWRGAAWSVGVLPGRAVTFVNVHLRRQLIKRDWLYTRDWSGLKDAILYSRDRLENVRDTLDYFSEEGPVVLAGDFNLPARYADIRSVMSGYRDCFIEAGVGWGKTVPNDVPVYRIDLVFVPPTARVFHSRAVPTQFSDHHMTLAEIVVPVPRAGSVRQEAVTDARSSRSTTVPKEQI